MLASIFRWLTLDVIQFFTLILVLSSQYRLMTFLHQQKPDNFAAPHPERAIFAMQFCTVLGLIGQVVFLFLGWIAAQVAWVNGAAVPGFLHLMAVIILPIFMCVSTISMGSSGRNFSEWVLRQGFFYLAFVAALLGARYLGLWY